MIEKIYAELDSSYEEMVDIRRHLHMHPEPSFNETKTAYYIRHFYEQLGVEVKHGVGGNGVIATIRGSKPGKTVALRADFDALSIQDQKEVAYKSKILGVMHACGHDEIGKHTSELQSRENLVCRLLLEKKNNR